ncbi:unnamed protein product [Prunus brigantina]
MVSGSKNDDTFDIKGIIEELVLLIGAVNISDCLPFLSPFDFQGLTKRMKKLSKRIDQLLEKIIGEHQEVSKSEQAHQGHRHKDFVDVMLSLMHQPLNPNDEQVYMMDRTNVKAILLDMISENVEEFYPERFIDGNVDLRGYDFQLLPFGSGRRGCPAMQLGLTTVRLVLANLVHCFNWDLPSGLKPEDVDMSETFGLSLTKTKHLLVMPIYRLR